MILSLSATVTSVDQTQHKARDDKSLRYGIIARHRVRAPHISAGQKQRRTIQDEPT
jgi:hypothetical protein